MPRIRSPEEEPDYNSELYSGNVGGPLSKKTSFFFSFDRRDIGDVAVVNAFVLNSDFQQVPYNTSVLVPRTRTVLSPRLDFALTPNNTLTVRYQYWHDTDQNAGVGQFALAQPGLQQYGDGKYAATERHAIVRHEDCEPDELFVSPHPQPAGSAEYRYHGQRHRRLYRRRQRNPV